MKFIIDLMASPDVYHLIFLGKSLVLPSDIFKYVIYFMKQKWNKLATRCLGYKLPINETGTTCSLVGALESRPAFPAWVSCLYLQISQLTSQTIQRATVNMACSPRDIFKTLPYLILHLVFCVFMQLHLFTEKYTLSVRAKNRFEC